jgi:hypothetical protein
MREKVKMCLGMGLLLRMIASHGDGSPYMRARKSCSDI